MSSCPSGGFAHKLIAPSNRQSTFQYVGPEQNEQSPLVVAGLCEQHVSITFGYVPFFLKLREERDASEIRGVDPCEARKVSDMIWLE